MKRILMTAATVANLFASPALAQSFPAGLGSHNTVAAGAAITQVASRHDRGHVAPRRDRVIVENPLGAYALSPDAIYGHRWPGARYDANGYYIDPNSPGRW